MPAATETATEKATPFAYDLEVQIRDGRLAPGDRVPSTKELSEKYGLARNAVLAELDVLKRLDLIKGEQGKGTFIRELIMRELSALRYLHGATSGIKQCPPWVLP